MSVQCELRRERVDVSSRRVASRRSEVLEFRAVRGHARVLALPLPSSSYLALAPLPAALPSLIFLRSLGVASVAVVLCKIINRD